LLTRIVAETFPYDNVHDLYQEYYRNALKASLTASGGEYVEISDAYSDAMLRKLRAVRHSYRLRDLLKGNLLPNLIDRFAGLLSKGPLMGPSPVVGVYRFTTGQWGEIRVCIDSMDFPDISEKAAGSCEIYFKSNYWPSYNYPSHVLPLPNMNPMAGRNLKLLKNLRTKAKERDLFIFFRVWGGRGEVEGIEHNMMLLKALSKVKCNSYILAYLVAGDIPSLGKRLDDIGVPWTTEAMHPFELWKNAAAARLNIVRMGNHRCIPWRMIDILSMGGVPVMDYKPMTLWPEPLIEGKHYLNLNLSPDKEEVGDISDKMDSWLQSDSLVSSISHNTADYFDRYLAPEMLGRSMIQTVEGWSASNRANRIEHAR
jgi:hypothetical protein